jgi:hypothetical protein
MKWGDRNRRTIVCIAMGLNAKPGKPEDKHSSHPILIRMFN